MSRKRVKNLVRIKIISDWNVKSWYNNIWSANKSVFCFRIRNYLISTFINSKRYLWEILFSRLSELLSFFILEIEFLFETFFYSSIILIDKVSDIRTKPSISYIFQQSTEDWFFHSEGFGIDIVEGEGEATFPIENVCYSIYQMPKRTSCPFVHNNVKAVFVIMKIDKNIL